MPYIVITKNRMILKISLKQNEIHKNVHINASYVVP